MDYQIKQKDSFGPAPDRDEAGGAGGYERPAALPTGEYEVVVILSEVRDSAKKKAGEVKAGAYLLNNFQIISGEYSGRTLENFEGLINLENDNPQVIEIGLRELFDFLTACGLPTETGGFDTNQIVGKRLRLRLKQKSVGADGFGADANGMRSNVTGYKPATPAPSVEDVPWKEPEGATVEDDLEPF